MVIPFNKIGSVPTRGDFVEPKINKIFKKKLKNNEPVIFMPNDVVDSASYAPYTSNVFGVLPCGTKICVTITGVYPSVDVLGSIEDIKAVVDVGHIKYKRIEQVMLYPFHGFSTTPVAYQRISFASLQLRNEAIKVFKNYKKELSGDDSSYGNDGKYHNKIAREHRFKTADWVRLTDYKIRTSNMSNCEWHLNVDINNYTKVKKADRAKLKESVLGPYIDTDRSLLAMWDIETYSNSGEFPEPGGDYTIFMICTTFFWYHSEKPLLSVCVVNKPTAPTPGIDVTIVCDTERDLLSAHMNMIKKFSPDFMGAFNGSGFDWPIYQDKVARAGMVEQLNECFSSWPALSSGGNADKILKYNFKSATLKVAADNKQIMKCIANFPGCIDMDVMFIFMQLYPKMETRMGASLNYFLEKNRITRKDDMPYQEMFDIYARADGSEQSLLDMSKVAHYCYIDCYRLQQLFLKRVVIKNRRETSNLSFTTIYNSFYNADGMRVSNLIGAYCNKRGVAFSVTSINKSDSMREHYPGAWVYEPIRGLHSDGMITVPLSGVNDNSKEMLQNNGAVKTKQVRARPISGLDYSSLYPSLMRAFNISPDRLVYTHAHARELIAAGYDLHHIEPFQYEIGATKGASGNQTATASGWTVKHRGVMSEGKPRIRYERVAEGKHVAVEDGPSLPCESMGILPYVVNKLFEKRKPVKALWTALAEFIEHLETEKLTEGIFNGEKMTLEYAQFTINVVNAKQLALKVLANTFYGQAGNYRTWGYELLVAAGITSAGQRNIKAVAELVTGMGCIVNYGDTDSLYLSCPEHLFEECDAEYFRAVAESPTGIPGPDTTPARVAWWTRQVEITMEYMNRLQHIVKDFLVADNGTTYMSMAYEEVGMPTVFCGKKKYFMTEHKAIVNFNNPEKVFKRGLEEIKQGTTEITKKISNEYTVEILKPDNYLNLIELAIAKIRRFYELASDPNSNHLFCQTARYKPDKANISINSFIEFATERYNNIAESNKDKQVFEPPARGDKFQYVCVERPPEAHFKINGSKAKFGKSDRMELMSVYKASLQWPEPLRIDTDYYLDTTIATLARFIASDDMFQMPCGAFGNAESIEYSVRDKYSIKSATAFLNNIATGIKAEYGFASTSSKQQGEQFKQLYKQLIAANSFPLAKLDNMYPCCRQEISLINKEFLQNLISITSFEFVKNQYMFSAYAGNAGNAGMFKLRLHLYNEKEAELRERFEQTANTITVWLNNTIIELRAGKHPVLVLDKALSAEMQKIINEIEAVQLLRGTLSKITELVHKHNLALINSASA